MAGGEERPLVAFFINKSVLQNTKVSGRGPYHATARITTLIEGREEEIVIHNIYNPNEQSGDLRHPDGRYEGIPKKSCLPMLEGALEKHHGKEQIVVGDFNLYHSRWAGESSRRSPSVQTEYMMAMMDREGMDLCLEPGTITRPPADMRSTHGSTIDLVWATEGVQKMIRYCKVSHKLDCASDHLPIVTAFEYSTREPVEVKRRRFRDLDTEKKKVEFRNTLYRELGPVRRIGSKKDLDQAINSMTAAIQKAIDQTVPTSTICPRSLPGFTEECREAIDEVKRAQRWWKAHPTTENLVEYQ